MGTIPISTPTALDLPFVTDLSVVSLSSVYKPTFNSQQKNDTVHHLLHRQYFIFHAVMHMDISTVTEKRRCRNTNDVC